MASRHRLQTIMEINYNSDSRPKVSVYLNCYYYIHSIKSEEAGNRWTVKDKDCGLWLASLQQGFWYTRTIWLFLKQEGLRRWSLHLTKEQKVRRWEEHTDNAFSLRHILIYGGKRSTVVCFWPVQFPASQQGHERWPEQWTAQLLEHS